MEDNAAKPRPDGLRVPPTILPPDLKDLGGNEGDDGQEDLFALLERVSQAIESLRNGETPADRDTLFDFIGLLEHRRAFYEDQIQLEMIVERPSTLAKYVLWDGSSGLIEQYRRVIEVLNTLIAELKTLVNGSHQP